MVSTTANDKTRTIWDAYSAEITALVTGYAAAGAAIEANATLNSFGKSEQLSRLYDADHSTLEDLKAARLAQLKERAAKLDRALISIPTAMANDPTAAISFRDALLRADGLETADDAATLMAQALRIGDEILARAVVMRAMQGATSADALFATGAARWADVIEQYLATKPAAMRVQFDELREAQEYVAILEGRVPVTSDTLARNWSESITAPKWYRSQTA